jgi:hypothetical protein
MKRCAKWAANANLVFWAILLRARRDGKNPGEMVFDSSVLVPALLPDHEHHARSFAAFAAASPKTAGCAAHSLAEVYATLTRYPGEQRLSAEYAALLVQEIEHRLTLVWLDGDDYRAAIGNIAKMGIVGGALYPPSGVKLRPSERRYKPYIVVLLVRYRLDNFPADLLFVI